MLKFEQMTNLIIEALKSTLYRKENGLREYTVREIGYILWILKVLDAGTVHLRSYRDEGLKILKKRKLSEEENGRETINFENEIWDTSLALIAFSEGGHYKTVKGILNYFSESYVDRGVLKGSYDGDIWETCFATIAMFHVIESGALSREELEKEWLPRLQETMRWFLRLLEDSNGYVVSPQYSSLIGFVLLKIDGLLEEHAIESLLADENSRKIFGKLVERVSEESYDFLDDISEDLDRFWQAALVALFLSELQNHRFEREGKEIDVSHAASLMKFHEAMQDNTGSFESMRTEDLALSILALLNIAKLSIYSTSIERLSREDFIHNAKRRITQSIDRPSQKALFYRDEDGAFTIYVTKRRQKLMYKIVFVLAAIATTISNYDTLREFFVEKLMGQ